MKMVVWGAEGWGTGGGRGGALGQRPAETQPGVMGIVVRCDGKPLKGTYSDCDSWHTRPPIHAETPHLLAPSELLVQIQDNRSCTCVH